MVVSHQHLSDLLEEENINADTVSNVYKDDPKEKQVALYEDTNIEIATTQKIISLGPTQQDGKLEKMRSSKTVENYRQNPLLLYSSNPQPDKCPKEADNVHSMMVDKVKNVLASDDASYDGSNQSMFDSELSRDDEDMGEKLGDDLTLGQAQEELHKEALVRKESHLQDVSPKKGRIEGSGRGDQLLFS